MFNRNQLDEMQEQKLLHIERNGCWFAFWGLLLALVVEALLGMDMKALAGEWVLFMALAVYLGIACSRAGIWDRRLRSDARTNLVVSLVAGLVTAAVWFFVIERRAGNVRISLGGAAFTFVLVAVLCFAALQISAAAMKKRQAKLNAEPEDD